MLLSLKCFRVQIRPDAVWLTEFYLKFDSKFEPSKPLGRTFRCPKFKLQESASAALFMRERGRVQKIFIKFWLDN